MPTGSKHIRAWRRNGQWRLYVVRVDAYSGWEDWWAVEDWYDLMTYDTQAERDWHIANEYRELDLPRWRRRRRGHWRMRWQSRQRVDCDAGWDQVAANHFVVS